ncbi:ribokinase [Acrocarpospora pleiomorpha]|uniref:Ribokinase n=1 Tax=Acrocarpospora pleiomorpha TaxID=90975 RepID=A0A5M3XQY3_9ACTN|nr:carbohydrate kinase [Acrocarpospora pleiomorpha]GES20738.1 ribokinase [Acrocarpospora pleiomorpha]
MDNASTVTVLGEAVVDLLPANDRGGFHAYAGGSPLNVAVALARLGEPTTLLARMSRSRFGQLLRAHAETNGVTLAGPLDQPEPASLAVASLDGDGVATYDFYLDGTADWQWSAPELTLPPDTTAVHAGSLTCYRPPGAAAVADFLTRLHHDGDTLVSFDPNIRSSVITDLDEARGQTTRLLSTAHLVKASSEDLETLYPGRAVADIAREWATLGPSLIVITLGADGAYAVSAHHELRVPPQPITVVDTVGAGDAFTAGLLWALRGGDHATPAALPSLGRDHLAAVVEQASHVAGITCTRPGADPPRQDEL